MTNRSKLGEIAEKWCRQPMPKAPNFKEYVTSVTDLLVRVDADARKESEEEIEALSKALADLNDQNVALEKELARAKEERTRIVAWLRSGTFDEVWDDIACRIERGEFSEDLSVTEARIDAEKIKKARAWIAAKQAENEANQKSRPHACCSCPVCVPDKPLFGG